MDAADRKLFLNIGKSQSSKQGNDIKQGTYRLVITGINFFTAEKKGKGFSFEFYVKESRNIEGAVNRDTKQPEYANAVGTTCRATYLLQSDSSEGNIKAFVEALDGDKYDDKEEAFADLLADLTSSAQPARGLEIVCETTQKLIKKGENAGKMGTFPKWTHVDVTAEQKAANEKMLPAAKAA